MYSTQALIGWTYVLLRGIYQATRRTAGHRTRVVAIDYRYNSMLPVPGHVYPRAKLWVVMES